MILHPALAEEPLGAVLLRIERCVCERNCMKPKWFLILGVILIVVGTAWFLHSLGVGGGSGSVLVILAGFCCFVVAIVVDLVRK